MAELFVVRIWISWILGFLDICAVHITKNTIIQSSVNCLNLDWLDFGISGYSRYS